MNKNENRFQPRVTNYGDSYSALIRLAYNTSNPVALESAFSALREMPDYDKARMFDILCTDECGVKELAKIFEVYTVGQ